MFWKTKMYKIPVELTDEITALWNKSLKSKKIDDQINMWRRVIEIEPRVKPGIMYDMSCYTGQWVIIQYPRVYYWQKRRSKEVQDLRLYKKMTEAQLKRYDDLMDLYTNLTNTLRKYIKP